MTSVKAISGGLMGSTSRNVENTYVSDHCFLKGHRCDSDPGASSESMCRTDGDRVGEG